MLKAKAGALAALVLLLATAAAPAPVAAASMDCPEHFPGGRGVALVNERLAADARALCFSAFALLHSGVTRTPLWVAEHLTRASIADARDTPREGEFHAEDRLTRDERAELSDYRRSGYDRGHMAPSADMPDAQAEEESYTLANIVPQAPELNWNLWAGIDAFPGLPASVREEAMRLPEPEDMGQRRSRPSRSREEDGVFKPLLNLFRRGGRVMARKRTLEPFADDVVSVGIGDLTAENGLDRVTLYDDVKLTRDKMGLERAREELRDLLAAVVAALEVEEDLPDKLPPPEADADEVDNPFR